MKARTALALAIGSAVAFTVVVWFRRSPEESRASIQSGSPDDRADEDNSSSRPDTSGDTFKELDSLEALGGPASDMQVAMRNLVVLHERLLSKSSRSGTLAALRAAWPDMPLLARIAVIFLVGGHSDTEIARFRQALLVDLDPRVVAFVGRISLMGEIDESSPTVADRRERLRLRLDGQSVTGFNAKDYTFFWECVFYEVFTKLGSSFPNQEFIDAFEDRHKVPGPQGLSAELTLYNECFNNELTHMETRASLARTAEHLQPSESKSMIFRMLLYRPDGKVPADVVVLAQKMALDPAEDDLDRYLCVRRLREGASPESGSFFRDVLAVEMSRPRQNLGIARETATGLLETAPDELSNPNSYYLIMKFVSNVAKSETHQGELSWIIPAMLRTGELSVRRDLEQLASSLSATAPSAAKMLKELLDSQPLDE